MTPALAALALLAMAPESTTEHSGPQFDYVPDYASYAPIGEPFSLSIGVVDAGGDFTLTARELPPGASFKIDRSGSACEKGSSCRHQGELTWTPSDSQMGSYKLVLEAESPRGKEVREVKITVTERWETYLMPGLRYSGYFPTASADFGALHGVSAELVVATWSHQDDHHGPSHGRSYLAVDLLSSKLAGRATVFSVGTDLSFERNPGRRWLIPMFGFEMGGLFSNAMGNRFFVVPSAGAFFYVRRSVLVSAEAGYLFPTRDVDRLGGVRLKGGASFTFW